MRKLAVVGHTEWVEFLRVPHLPQPGQILHAEALLAQPAGGGAVAAVQLARLTGEAHFITALGRDALGEQALERLNALGLKVSVVWRDQPTRRAITFIDADGERVRGAEPARSGTRDPSGRNGDAPQCRGTRSYPTP